MEKYVFFIGGSGARVYTAFIHSAAAGILESKEISTLLIDSDESNAANINSIELYRKYNRLYNSFNKRERTIFTCNIRMESETVLSPIESNVHSLELAIENTNTIRKRILRCFYTKEEIRQDLKGGFYAHPNIGCVFFSSFNNMEFNKCLNKIENQLNNGKEVMIVLVGSIFGGTGAAGIPTIFKIINNKFKDIDNKKLQIGGVFLTPYFRVNGKSENENKNIPINMEDFYFNTYEALSYYSANKNMNFQSIYLIGQQNQDIVNNKYADSGSAQRNKPHIIELFASLAIDRFFSCPEENGVFGLIRKNKLDWNSFPKIRELDSNDSMIIMRLADFARAHAIFITEICSYVESIQGEFKEKYGIMIPQWYKVFNLKKSSTKSEMEVIRQYSISFIEWLYMINSSYSIEGILESDENIELFGSVLKNVYEVSKNIDREGIGKEETKTNIKQFRDKFNTLVDNASNIEYALDKVLLVLSMAGIVSGHTAEAGAIGLFFKIISLVSNHK